LELCDFGFEFEDAAYPGEAHAFVGHRRDLLDAFDL